MKPTPPGWPRISSSLFYEDAKSAIDFLVRAFGFEPVLVVEGEGDRVEHSELRYGDGLVMVGSTGASSHRPAPLPMVSPRAVGGNNTQVLCVFVDDVDAHAAHARAHGAVIADEPTTNDYGEDHWADRSYRAIDPEGHQWWFMQRVRGPGA
jgi:uncharacterized glyoxalase superfamily protein PhnB